MPKYMIEWDMGFCGTDDTMIVEAESPEEAEQLLWEHATQMISIGRAIEAKEEDIESGYYDEL